MRGSNDGGLGAGHTGPRLSTHSGHHRAGEAGRRQSLREQRALHHPNSGHQHVGEEECADGASIAMSLRQGSWRRWTHPHLFVKGIIQISEKVSFLHAGSGEVIPVLYRAPSTRMPSVAAQTLVNVQSVAHGGGDRDRERERERAKHPPPTNAHRVSLP